MARKHSLTLALIHESKLRAAAGDIQSLSFFFLLSTRYSLYSLVIENSSGIVKSRRGLRTGSRPDGKLPAGNHRQFRCYCPLGPQNGVSAAGIDSVAEFRGVMFRFTIRNTSLGPGSTGIRACVLRAGR
jgi:hypothetical protein